MLPLAVKEGQRPSDKKAKRVLSLPIHPYLEAAAIDRVCDALRAAA